VLRFTCGIDANWRTICCRLLRLQKIAGIKLDEADALLTEIVTEQKDEALISLQSQRLDERKNKAGATAKLSENTVLKNAKIELDSRWTTYEGQPGIVDAKVTIRILNTRLQERRAKTVNAHIH
jgi:hypothetical protein